MKKFVKLIGVLIVSANMQGCAKLWPYKSDFDCPTPKGERCKSLYDINKMADAGIFAPQNMVLSNKTAKKKTRCMRCIW